MFFRLEVVHFIAFLVIWIQCGIVGYVIGWYHDVDLKNVYYEENYTSIVIVILLLGPYFILISVIFLIGDLYKKYIAKYIKK